MRRERHGVCACRRAQTWGEDVDTRPADSANPGRQVSRERFFRADVARHRQNSSISFSLEIEGC